MNPLTCSLTIHHAQASLPACWDTTAAIDGHRLGYAVEAGSTSLDESALVDRIARGQQEAFWELWATHQEAIFGTCLRRMGGHHAEAEDACSCVMQRALEALPRAAGRVRNVGGWLSRLAHNVCIDVLRAHKRRQQGCCALGLDALHDEDLACAWNENLRPDRMILGIELRAALVEAVTALPDRMAKSAQLYFFDDWSYEMIAASLGTTSGNIRKRIQEARALLRVVLREHQASGVVVQS